MKILYGFTNCTNSKYNELFCKSGEYMLLADQKYHSLLIDGLSKNGAQVKCVSGLPINRSVTKRLFINEADEEENGVSYHYVKSVNFPIIRQLCIYFGTKRFVRKNFKKGGEKTYIVCDCLNLANAYGMLKAAKKRTIPIIFVVTDIPEFQRGKFLKCINDKIIAGADGFIFLTKQMNDKVNPYKKPFIVLEGHSDGGIKPIAEDERYENRTGEKVVVYAGSIQKLYGIGNLVEGFLKADVDGARLVIYGNGDYKEDLAKICKTHKNVEYNGVKPNAEIVGVEQRVALLVNPRPTAPEYTKYSFPSKTMEYMASGTPVLTTKLPGIPEEYDDYLYFIDDETPDGIAKKLIEVLALPADERYAVGKAAQKFVTENKSNAVQAKKVIEFIERTY